MSDIYGMADALEQVETELAEVLTFGGTDYACIIGARTDGNDLGAGGFSTAAGIEVVVRQSLFTTLPTAHDEITVNGKLHKITGVALSPDESCLVLTCEDAYKDS